MSTLVRDAWADATVVATHEVLDDELAAVRRRLWLRRALGLVLSLVALLVAFTLAQRLVDPRFGELWTVSPHAVWGSGALLGVGVVLIVIGNGRTTGAGRTFVEPADLLSRTDRAWLRAQVQEGRPVGSSRSRCSRSGRWSVSCAGPSGPAGPCAGWPPRLRRDLLSAACRRRS